MLTTFNNFAPDSDGIKSLERRDPHPPDDGRRGGIAPIAIEDEMRKSYLDYAMSVIVSRPCPMYATA